MEEVRSFESQWTSTGLHGVTSQKILLFFYYLFYILVLWIFVTVLSVSLLHANAVRSVFFYEALVAPYRTYMAS
jgi:hypothetical protein